MKRENKSLPTMLSARGKITAASYSLLLSVKGLKPEIILRVQVEEQKSILLQLLQYITSDLESMQLELFGGGKCHGAQINGRLLNHVDMDKHSDSSKCVMMAFFPMYPYLPK